MDDRIASIRSYTDNMTKRLESEMRDLIDGYDYLNTLSARIPETIQQTAENHKNNLLNMPSELYLDPSIDGNALVDHSPSYYNRSYESNVNTTDQELETLKKELQTISHDRMVMDVLNRPTFNNKKIQYSSVDNSQVTGPRSLNSSSNVVTSNKTINKAPVTNTLTSKTPTSSSSSSNSKSSSSSSGTTRNYRKVQQEKERQENIDANIQLLNSFIEIPSYHHQLPPTTMKSKEKDSSPLYQPIVRVRSIKPPAYSNTHTTQDYSTGGGSTGGGQLVVPSLRQGPLPPELTQLSIPSTAANAFASGAQSLQQQDQQQRGGKKMTKILPLARYLYQRVKRNEADIHSVKEILTQQGVRQEQEGQRTQNQLRHFEGTLRQQKDDIHSSTAALAEDAVNRIEALVRDTRSTPITPATEPVSATAGAEPPTSLEDILATYKVLPVRSRTKTTATQMETIESRPAVNETAIIVSDDGIDGENEDHMNDGCCTLAGRGSYQLTGDCKGVKWSYVNSNATGGTGSSGSGLLQEILTHTCLDSHATRSAAAGISVDDHHHHHHRQPNELFVVNHSSNNNDDDDDDDEEGRNNEHNDESFYRRGDHNNDDEDGNRLFSPRHTAFYSRTSGVSATDTTTTPPAAAVTGLASITTHPIVTNTNNQLLQELLYKQQESIQGNTDILQALINQSLIQQTRLSDDRKLEMEMNRQVAEMHSVSMNQLGHNVMSVLNNIIDHQMHHKNEDEKRQRQQQHEEAEERNRLMEIRMKELQLENQHMIQTAVTDGVTAALDELALWNREGEDEDEEDRNDGRNSMKNTFHNDYGFLRSDRIVVMQQVNNNSSSSSSSSSSAEATTANPVAYDSGLQLLRSSTGGHTTSSSSSSNSGSGSNIVMPEDTAPLHHHPVAVKILNKNKTATTTTTTTAPSSSSSSSSEYSNALSPGFQLSIRKDVMDSQRQVKKAYAYLHHHDHDEDEREEEEDDFTAVHGIEDTNTSKNSQSKVSKHNIAKTSPFSTGATITTTTRKNMINPFKEASSETKSSSANKKELFWLWKDPQPFLSHVIEDDGDDTHKVKAAASKNHTNTLTRRRTRSVMPQPLVSSMICQTATHAVMATEALSSTRDSWNSDDEEMDSDDDDDDDDEEETSISYSSQDTNQKDKHHHTNIIDDHHHHMNCISTTTTTTTTTTGFRPPFAADNHTQSSVASHSMNEDTYATYHSRSSGSDSHDSVGDNNTSDDDDDDDDDGSSGSSSMNQSIASLSSSISSSLLQLSLPFKLLTSNYNNNNNSSSNTSHSNINKHDESGRK